MPAKQRSSRKDSRHLSKTKNFKGVPDQTPASILSQLLRTRSFGVAVFLLVTVTSAIYYDLIFTIGDSIRDAKETYADLYSTYISPPGPAFEIVDLPGRGKGVIALRDIRQGERLFREEPLFLVPRSTEQSPIALIYEALGTLNESQIETFSELSYIPPEGEFETGEEYAQQVPLAIVQTNAVTAGEGVGVFPQMARLNHGCSSAFSAVYSWREDEGVIVVHAIRPIKKGEEILTTYSNTKKARVDRREQLAQNYAFNCTCAVCSLPDDLSRASDKRLVQMQDLYDQLSSWARASITGDQAVELIRKIWGIGTIQQYWSERGRLAADAVWVSAAHSDATAVREWGTLAVRWYSYELGKDSEYVRNMQETIARPRLHKSWGTRDPLKVGGPGRRVR